MRVAGGEHDRNRLNRVEMGMRMNIFVDGQKAAESKERT